MPKVLINFSDDEFKCLKTSNLPMTHQVRILVREYFEIPNTEKNSPGLRPKSKKVDTRQNEPTSSQFIPPPKQPHGLTITEMLNKIDEEEK